MTEADDMLLPLCVNDLMRDLGLSTGANPDHEYCNLKFESRSHISIRFKKLAWKVLVAGCDGDPLLDCLSKLVRILIEKGVETISHLDAEDCHGIELFDPSKAKALNCDTKFYSNFRQFFKKLV